MSKNRYLRHAPHVPRVASAALLLIGCTRLVEESFEGYSLQPEDVGDAGMSASPDGGMPAAAAEAGADTTTAGNAGVYRVEERQIDSGGIARTFLLVRPERMPDTPLPLILSFHGERDTLENSAESIRAGLPIEQEAAGGAVFVYPRAANAAPGWPFYNDAGRTIETAFISALINSVQADLGTDMSRVFLVGWDGGAALANALACRLGSNIVRGVAAHSGSFYEVPREDGQGNDFQVDVNTGATSCLLPDALLIWGKSDQSAGTTYADDGAKTLNWYRATLRCQLPQDPWANAPECVSDSACSRSVVWCPIDGLGHSIWPGAAATIWQFFDGLR